MRAKIILAAAVAALCFSLSAFASNKVQIIENCDENGKLTYYYATKEHLKECPSWDMKSEPPLSVGQAIQVAKDWIKAKHADFKDVEVSNISISKIWDDEVKDRWYYSIFAQASIDVNGINAQSNFDVLILMDGTVVEGSSNKEE